MKKKVLVISIFLAAFLLIGAAGNYLYKINKSFDLFAEVVKNIANNYVLEVDPETLVDAGIKGMLETLDPYTTYYDASENEDIDMMTFGTYVGIGIRVNTVDSMMTIVDVHEGYPADQAGINIGDVIYMIDSTEVIDLNAPDLRPYTKGKSGEIMKMKILRGKSKDTLDFTITRKVITLENITFKKVLDGQIGYIKLDRFTKSTGYDLRKEVYDMNRKNKLKGFILDLRDNPGGLLDAAISVCEIFVPEGSKIVSTKGRNVNRNRVFKAVGEPTLPDVPLVVLINENSASASEIVAGAIQDLDRGVIIGERSFGKGLVQSIMELPYNSSLKITTAKYYTPSGRSIQRLKFAQEYEKSKVVDETDTNYFYTKNKREVRELSGIMPDISISDSLEYDIITDLKYKNMFFIFANYFSAEHDTVVSDFKVDGEIFSEFIEFLKEKDYVFNERSIKYLDKITEIAEDNEYPENVMNRIDGLKSSIKDESIDLIKLKQSDIADELENEIYRRFHTENEVFFKYLKNDDYLERSLQILDSDRYNEILAITEENNKN